MQGAELDQDDEFVNGAASLTVTVCAAPEDCFLGVVVFPFSSLPSWANCWHLLMVTEQIGREQAASPYLSVGFAVSPVLVQSGEVGMPRLH